MTPNCSSSSGWPATLSSQFARLHVEEIAPAILGALEQVGLAIDVQACALIEFTEGAIGAMHTWPSAAATFGEAACPPRWLVERLTHREVVPIPGSEIAPAAGRDGVIRVWAYRWWWRSRSSVRWSSGRADPRRAGRIRWWNGCG